MNSNPQVGTGQQAGPPLYGRQWSLEVSTTDGQQVIAPITGGTFSPETLRITFDVHTPCFQNAYWYADIVIYNLSKIGSDIIIKAAPNVQAGMIVTLKAGYVGGQGQYDVIWVGPIFQATFLRENVTDYKLTLHCVLGLLQAISGEIQSTVYSGMDQSEIVSAMIEQLGLELQTELPAKLSNKTLPRDKVVIDPVAALNDIAKDNKLVWFLSQRNLTPGKTGIYFGDVSADIPTTAAYTYTPNIPGSSGGGLLGTPVQTQFGIDFSVLLDPRIRAQIPWQVVEVKEVVIQQNLIQPQQSQMQYKLATDGQYVVVDIHHRGDSRGNIWQTDLTTCVVVGNVLLSLIGGS
jgi:hypothetical protein